MRDLIKWNIFKHITYNLKQVNNWYRRFVTKSIFYGLILPMSFYFYMESVRFLRKAFD